MTAAMMVTGYAVARHRGYGTEAFPGWRAVALRLIGALPGLGLVGLIFIEFAPASSPRWKAPPLRWCTH